jgi:O-antigen/teichoic acid export membrane protein
MPLVVNHLGDRLYGVWVLVGTVTGYFAFLDLGLSKAVMRFVSQALGRGDKEKADEWISVALVCFGILAVISILLSFGVWLAAPWFLSDPEDAKVIPLALLFALLAFSVTLPSRCFLGILEAHVRKDVVSAIHVLINLFRAGTIFLVIYHKGSLLGLVTVAAVYTVMDGFLITLSALYVHGAFHFNPSALTSENIKIFSGYAFSSFVTQIMDIFRYKSYPLIITPFLGLAALTPFAIAERLTQMLVSVCNGILLNLTPAFSQLEGAGGVEGNEKLKKSYFFSYKLSCYLGVFAVGMTLMLASPFIERWMGARYLNAVPILNVLLIGIFFSLIQIPTLCFLFAVSRHRFYAITNTLHAVLTIVLCLALVAPFKLLGVAMGISLVTFCVKFLLQPIGVLSLVGMKLFDYHFKKSLPNIMIPSLFVIGYYLLTRGFFQPEYLVIFAVGLVGSLAFAAYIFFCGFDKSERTMLLRAIQPADGFMK